MNTVQAIEEAIQQLPETNLIELHHWFNEFIEDIWDKQIEQDATLGKLPCRRSLSQLPRWQSE